jgi:hypothetical protein
VAAVPHSSGQEVEGRAARPVVVGTRTSEDSECRQSIERGVLQSPVGGGENLVNEGCGPKQQEDVTSGRRRIGHDDDGYCSADDDGYCSADEEYRKLVKNEKTLLWTTKSWATTMMGKKSCRMADNQHQQGERRNQASNKLTGRPSIISISFGQERTKPKDDPDLVNCFPFSWQSTRGV